MITFLIIGFAFLVIILITFAGLCYVIIKSVENSKNSIINDIETNRHEVAYYVNFIVENMNKLYVEINKVKNQ